MKGEQKVTKVTKKNAKTTEVTKKVFETAIKPANSGGSQVKRKLSVAQMAVLERLQTAHSAGELALALEIPGGPLARCLNVLIERSLIRVARAKTKPMTYIRTGAGSKALKS